MKKIILFHPDAEDRLFWIPYSILSIGSALTAEGYDVILLDENLKQNKEELREYINRILIENIQDTLLVGISTFIGHQIRNGLAFAKLVRTYNKSVPIVWGGWHPTILTDITIKNEYVDFIIRGQGEVTIVELANRLKKGESNFSTILGLTYKEKENVFTNADRPFIKRSQLPRYNWDIIEIKPYIVNDPAINNKTISYISSQGCPMNCGFCSDMAMYKRGWYAITAQQMFDDIKYLLTNNDINGISFYDSNFTVDRNRIFDFCKMIINSNLLFKWAAATDLCFLKELTSEEWKLLREAGCVRLLVGAESGSEEILKLIGKKFNPGDVVEIASKSIKYGISIYFTMIVGWPPNPDDDFNETVNLIERIRHVTMEHEFIVHIYAPFAGTPLYGFACEHGYVPPHTLEEWANYDYYKITTPWINEDFLEKVSKYRMKLDVGHKMYIMRKNK